MILPLIYINTRTDILMLVHERFRQGMYKEQTCLDYDYGNNGAERHHLSPQATYPLLASVLDFHYLWPPFGETRSVNLAYA